MVIIEEHFKWHLEAFASELFICNSFINFYFILSYVFAAMANA